MEDQSINYIRESTRKFLNLNRQKQKHEDSDIHRSFETIRTTPENVQEISNKLQTKSSISAKELQTLKNCLMDFKYIEIFLRVHGALRGLIRELTCSNVKKQFLSAGCLCNLALGDHRSCRIIAKATGSYLNAALNNQTVELVATCAWALGNLAGSDNNVCNILVSQGALNKLAKMYTHEDIQNAALYALLHFVYQLKDNLRPEDLHEILQLLTKLDISMSSSQILFLLSCHELFPEHMSDELLLKILVNLPSLIQSHHTCDQDLCCVLIYLIRTLANSGRSNDILKYLFVNGVSLKPFFNDNSVTSRSVLWLLGNIYNKCSDKQMFFKFVS